VPKTKAPENHELNRTIRQPVSENDGAKDLLGAEDYYDKQRYRD
jgi:hypothetical protein